MTDLRCPACGHPPCMVVGGAQAFCGNEECPVFTFPSGERSDYFANVTTVDLLGFLDLPGDDPSSPL